MVVVVVGTDDGMNESMSFRIDGPLGSRGHCRELRLLPDFRSKRRCKQLEEVQWPFARSLQNVYDGGICAMAGGPRLSFNVGADDNGDWHVRWRGVMLLMKVPWTGEMHLETSEKASRHPRGLRPSDVIPTKENNNDIEHQYSVALTKKN